METIIHITGILILLYFALLWSGYLLLLVGTFLSILRKFQEAKLNNIISTFDEKPSLPITIMMPLYNESHRVINAITAILNSDYKNVHLIAINDGSLDNTLNILIEQYRLIKIAPAFQKKFETCTVHAYYQSTLVPNFIVIDKAHSPYANSGADCHNAGLAVCRTPLFLTVDADTILEKEALSRMIFTYLSHPHCVAIGGNIYVPDTASIKNGKLLQTNIPTNPLLGVQVCEYLRSFLYGHESWGLVGGALCHPGAFTLLETQAVLEVGGYDAYNFSYDADIIMKLHSYMRSNKHPYTITYAPNAIAWAEQPGTLKGFWRQPSNWQRGLLRCLSRHKKMIFNPRYGATGMITFPYYILFEIYGPVVEAFSYLFFLLALIYSSISFSTLLWFIILAWGYMLFITMACVLLSLATYNKYYKKMDIVRLFALTLLDMVFYIQFKAFCALSSSIHYFVNRIRGKAL